MKYDRQQHYDKMIESQTEADREKFRTRPYLIETPRCCETCRNDACEECTIKNNIPSEWRG